MRDNTTENRRTCRLYICTRDNWSQCQDTDLTLGPGKTDMDTSLEIRLGQTRTVEPGSAKVLPRSIDFYSNSNLLF